MQLWALKEATPDTKGLDDVPHLASSGRTSFPADKDVPKALYRVVGYRVCGERAVRVDILERLADLIRPALSWRSGSPQPKPPGAVQGGGFTVTGNMTSLTGTSGEDFASVLRSLGYRMEKRPKPVEPTPVAEETPAAPAAESAAAETPTPNPPQSCRLSRCCRDAAAEASAAETAPETPVEAAIAPVADAAPEATAAPAEPVAAIEAAPETPVAAGTAPVAPEAAASETAAEPAAEAKAEEKPAEPEMIEVWRPGRPPEERRPRPPRREGERARPSVSANAGRARRSAAPAAAATPHDGAQPAPPAEAAAAPAEGEAKPERRDDRPRHGEVAIAPSVATSRNSAKGRPPPRERRGGERPDRDRQDRGPRREGGRRDFKDRDRDEPREWRDPKEQRGVADPNSPFAKLAALKEQLEASKER